MFVEFRKLTFRNILSYGNVDTELDFRQGLNVIKAKNGSGKSTILDALTFVLYGKPYRDIKMSELINRTNKKNLEVSIELKINKDIYTIRRGLKPTLFEMLKNGQPMDMLSSKKLNQDEIDKLLGINLKLFKNIVCIAITNNKPFLELSISEKRALIENIFNIDIISLMFKDVKKRKTLKINEREVRSVERQGVLNNIDDNKQYLENMRNYILNFNNLKNTQISIITENIKKNNERLSKALRNIKIANEKIAELNEEIGEKIDDSLYNKKTLEIGKTSSRIEQLEKTLSRLENSQLCPVCNSPLTGEHAIKHIKSIQTEKEQLESLFNTLKTEQNELSENIKKYNEKNNFINNIKIKLRDEENLKETLTSRISEYEQALNNENNKECPSDITKYEDKLKSLNETLADIELNISELDEQILVDNELIEILGDNGIKTYFFRKLTNILNRNIANYLDKFELPIQLQFDDTMQETIVENMVPSSYGSYSGGERCRIDMAILLSFFDVSRLISNWSCNLLFIDELLDSGIDDSGLEQFIATLYNIITENKKKLGIYIVSHKLNEIKVQTSSTIEIKKKTGFSEMQVKYE